MATPRDGCNRRRGFPLSTVAGLSTFVHLSLQTYGTACRHDQLSTVPFMTASEIDHDAPTPVYRQIAALIIADIESGSLVVDRKIPSESALTQRFGVARETARSAVRYLREEGWVYTVPQRGTYVANRQP